MNISLADLKTLFADAGASAIAQYERGLHPEKDLLSFRQARAFLISNGYSGNLLFKWYDAGLISARKGEKSNSKWQFSKAEIMSVIASAKLKTFIINNN